MCLCARERWSGWWALSCDRRWTVLFVCAQLTAGGNGPPVSPQGISLEMQQVEVRSESRSSHGSGARGGGGGCSRDSSGNLKPHQSTAAAVSLGCCSQPAGGSSTAQAAVVVSVDYAHARSRRCRRQPSSTAAERAHEVCGVERRSASERHPEEHAEARVKYGCDLCKRAGHKRQKSGV